MMADLTRDQWVKEQLAARGMADTKSNRTTLGKQYDKIYIGGSRTDWRTYFKQQFPQFANMLDGGAGEAEARSIFGDLIDLFIDVANNPDSYDLTSTAGKEAFKVKVQGTQYAQKTTENRAKWDAMDAIEKKEMLKNKASELRANYAGLGLTVMELDNLALQALRDGRNEVELKYLAFSKLADRPGGTLAETKEYMDLVAQLRAYDYDYNDNQVRAALTGDIMDGVPQSAELLLNKARYGAQQKYSAFSDLFKQGFTVTDVFEPYQQIASRLLERPVSDISIKNEMFRYALEHKNADGSALSISDWSARIKNEKQYGWQYTNNANQTVNSIAATLERAFGLIK
jgi:hypothetical protein